MNISITCDMADIRDFLEKQINQAERGLVLERQVDALENELRLTKVALDNAVVPARIPVSSAQVISLIRSVLKGEKINAIKEVRGMTDLGLKQSKDLVEACLGCCDECKSMAPHHYPTCSKSVVNE
jgi:ribosomal protein L7/L12